VAKVDLAKNKELSKTKLKLIIQCTKTDQAFLPHVPLLTPLRASMIGLVLLSKEWMQV